MVKKPLIRPAIYWGGMALGGGGTLDSHENEQFKWQPPIFKGILAAPPQGKPMVNKALLRETNG